MEQYPWRVADVENVYTWCGAELDRNVEIPKIRVGDSVRIVIESSDEQEFSEKIYVKITDIVYYNKTSKECRFKPKLFHGIVEDTYRDEELWCKSGSKITFTPKQILEIPVWTEKTGRKLPQLYKPFPDYGLFSRLLDYNVNEALNLRGDKKIKYINDAYHYHDMPPNQNKTFKTMFGKYIREDWIEKN